MSGSTGGRGRRKHGQSNSRRPKHQIEEFFCRVCMCVRRVIYEVPTWNPCSDSLSIVIFPESFTLEMLRDLQLDDVTAFRADGAQESLWVSSIWPRRRLIVYASTFSRNEWMEVFTH